ncbi:MAG: translation initiation factor IF-2, partial [Bacteroidaceae bacterium]|nr:translation initiation factor IF-2 [Bacteroidaceae bacterium]
MSIRLSKVTKECNVGLQTVVEFLQKKGFGDVEASPNSKISEEQYELLLKEFSPDKGLRTQAEKLSQQRQENKESKKASSRSAKQQKKPEMIKVEVKKVDGPKVLGHIDLDAAKKPKEKPAQETAKQEAVAATPETVKEQTVQKSETATAETTAPKAEKPAIGTEVDGVFRLNPAPQAGPGLTVKGHIDLSALNQSTRPKKKSKEEKRREREEKNRPNGQQ